MEVMATLNKAAAEAMVEVGVHAATDVTGFGLLGHALRHGRRRAASPCACARRPAEIEGLDAAPHEEVRLRRPQAKPRLGRLVASAGRRASPRRTSVLVADPQTSGGLLIAVPADRLDRLLTALKTRGVTTRAVVGEVLARSDVSLEVV